MKNEKRVTIIPPSDSKNKLDPKAIDKNDKNNEKSAALKKRQTSTFDKNAAIDDSMKIESEKIMKKEATMQEIMTKQAKRNSITPTTELGGITQIKVIGRFRPLNEAETVSININS